MPPRTRAAADEPVRLGLIAYAYEVRPTDVVVAGEERRELRQPPDVGGDGLEQVRLTFTDGSTAELPRATILDVERDRELMPGFQHVDPETQQ